MHAHTSVIPMNVGRARVALSLLLAAIALLLSVRVAHSADIMPFVGVTRDVRGENDVRFLGGLALQGDVLPFLKDEVRVSYRSQTESGDLVRTKMWPVTASLWLTPIPTVYGGAGVGWYNVTYDYAATPLNPNSTSQTKQQFGVHVGGGFRVPLTSAMAVDLGGRYVMMRDQQSRLVPRHFNPDFWVADLGLAFHF